MNARAITTVCNQCCLRALAQKAADKLGRTRGHPDIIIPGTKQRKKRDVLVHVPVRQSHRTHTALRVNVVIVSS